MVEYTYRVVCKTLNDLVKLHVLLNFLMKISTHPLQRAHSYVLFPVGDAFFLGNQQNMKFTRSVQTFAYIDIYIHILSL
ncbi:hypothetical protein AOLI_G00071720 [Acnodon oligacanthus]